MNVHVLGSAAGGGFPQWNCNCSNCRGLREGTIRAAPRTQSSIAIRGEGDGWVLFNASPDIRTQLESFPALQPGRGVRDTAIVGIVLIDSQIDHTLGLLVIIDVAFLGVWDTVGAFGIPMKLFGIPFNKWNLFKDMTVSRSVRRAVHLVSVDETRKPFEPVGMRYFSSGSFELT